MSLELSLSKSPTGIESDSKLGKTGAKEILGFASLPTPRFSSALEKSKGSKAFFATSKGPSDLCRWDSHPVLFPLIFIGQKTE